MWERHSGKALQNLINLYHQNNLHSFDRSVDRNRTKKWHLKCVFVKCKIIFTWWFCFCSTSVFIVRWPWQSKTLLTTNTLSVLSAQIRVTNRLLLITRHSSGALWPLKINDGIYGWVSSTWNLQYTVYTWMNKKKKRRAEKFCFCLFEL